MPPCEMANACTQPHKTMYTHLAATRMYTYRMLWMDMILPEPDRDSGSVRTLVILKILLALRVHVSVVTVQRSGAPSPLHLPRIGLASRAPLDLPISHASVQPEPD